MDDLERLVASDAIRQLAHRYSVYFDARDLDRLVELYPPDARASGGRRGREALRQDFDLAARSVGITFLQVGNHVIDFESEDQATGIVYCRGEIQDGGPDTRRWIIHLIQYHDTYRRIEGRWYFTRRKHRLVAGTELGQNPLDLPPANWPESQTGQGSLPHDLETWKNFWGPPEH